MATSARSREPTEPFGGRRRRVPGRWTPRGIPAVFASATLSLAALERVGHTDPDLEPANLVCIPVDVDSSLAIESVDPRDLPPGWRTYPPPPALAGLGERWWESAATAVLSVPSVVASSRGRKPANKEPP